MITERITLNEERNVTLTAYIQDIDSQHIDIAKRPAVMVIPGGGYQYCSDREADPVAMAYLKAGYNAFILRYSVKEDAVWPNPLDDYEQAMSLIRSKADEWAVYEDKIAVCGFSAGGHLAACAATMSRNRPNAAILGYAVTKEDLAKMCIFNAPDVVSAVDRYTCPCFVFATRTDEVVPIANSIEFIQALDKNGVSFESHIYAYGPHGFNVGEVSTNPPGTLLCSRVPHWVQDSIEWLKDMFGEFGEGCMLPPACKAHCSGDYEDHLSGQCTLAYIKDFKGAEQVTDPIIRYIDENKTAIARNVGPAAYEMTVNDGWDGFYSIASNRTIEVILENSELTADDIARVEEALEKIENR